MIPLMRKGFLAVAFIILATSAEADWYSRGHGHPPTANKVYVCHGYTCRIVTPVTFTPAELASIASSLKREAATPGEERAAISKAVQTFEKIVGARIGTDADLPAMQFMQGADDQMDCIDEATNTTSLLLMLSENGYLRRHNVEPPSARGFFLDGRYPHATAVLAERAGGERWAVDSWPRANGEPPVIQRLSEWKRSRVHIPES